jgi:hypothetical protein
MAIPGRLSAQGSSGGLSMHVAQDSEGRNVVTFSILGFDGQDDVLAAFTFSSAKGFLGSSSNPSDQSGFANADKTLFGVNYQPVTKSSFVHLFFVTKTGDLLYMNNINSRVARLLPEQWSESAREFLRIERISGRKLNLQTVDFSGASRQMFEFSVNVSGDGSITLSK